MEGRVKLGGKRRGSMLIEYHGSGERYSGTLLMTSLLGNKVLCPTLSQERDLED